MEAQDILAATRKLEGSGMTRSQSEAIAESIVAAVAPLATRVDVAALKEQMATKADLASLKEQMATKKDMESVKVWYLVTFLGLVGSLLAIDAI